MSDEQNDMVLEFDTDISAAEKPPAFPIGTYPCSVQSIESGEAKSSGNRQIKVTLVIEPENYPADYPVEIEPDGVKLTHFVTATNKPRDKHRVRLLCETFGVAGGAAIVLSDFLGKEAQVEVSHDTYLGETQARVAKLLSKDA